MLGHSMGWHRQLHLGASCHQCSKCSAALQELGPKLAAKPLQRLSVDNAGRVLSAMSPRAAVSNLLVADNPWAFSTLKGMKETAAQAIFADVDIDSAAQLMNVGNHALTWYLLGVWLLNRGCRAAMYGEGLPIITQDYHLLGVCYQLRNRRIVALPK